MTVIIADASAVSRSVLKQILARCDEIDLCAAAADEKELFAKIAARRPDAVIADSSIFKDRGCDAVLSKFYEMKIPLVYFVQKIDNEHDPRGAVLFIRPRFASLSSEKMDEYSQTILRALKDLRRLFLFCGVKKYGAQTRDSPGAGFEKQGTVNKIDSLHKSLTRKFAGDKLANLPSKAYKAVLIGVSTGGPGTVLELLKLIGENFPLPIFITQHIDSFFDKNLIVWLNNAVSAPVRLAEDGEKPISGNVYFAPADIHMTFESVNESDFIIRLNRDEPVNFLRPSVDKMFCSAARVLGGNCVAVVLTGMGADGAKGCCEIKRAGGYTITQDEASCVVYGMPKAAFEAGGSTEVLPLDKIADRLRELCGA